MDTIHRLPYPIYGSMMLILSLLMNTPIPVVYHSKFEC